jgi:hypothetical protein
VNGDAVLVTALVAVALLVPAVPAGSGAQAVVDVHSGGLSARSPGDVELPDARVSGEPVTVRGPVGPFRVADTRSPPSGWTLVVTAPPPADARGRSIGAPLVVEATRVPVGGLGTVPGSPGALGTPRAILAAPPGAGAGLTEVEIEVSLTVPGDAASGVYDTVLVATIS